MQSPKRNPRWTGLLRERNTEQNTFQWVSPSLRSITGWIEAAIKNPRNGGDHRQVKGPWLQPHLQDLVLTEPDNQVVQQASHQNCSPGLRCSTFDKSHATSVESSYTLADHSKDIRDTLGEAVSGMQGRIELPLLLLPFLTPIQMP